MVITTEDLGPYKSPEERWADTIRIKEELIEWPFTRDMVMGAVRHFGSHHRPLLPYLLHDDQYNEIVIAEDNGDGYQFYDSDDEYRIPEIGSWREFAEWRGESIEDFAVEWELAESQWDQPLGTCVLEEHLPYDVSPYGRAFDVFHEVFYPPATYRFPIGELGLECGNAHVAWIQPKVALTFAQVFLDYEEAGIKIVLEDEWVKQRRARKGRGVDVADSSAKGGTQAPERDPSSLPTAKRVRLPSLMRELDAIMGEYERLPMPQRWSVVPTMVDSFLGIADAGSRPGLRDALGISDPSGGGAGSTSPPWSRASATPPKGLRLSAG